MNELKQENYIKLYHTLTHCHCHFAGDKILNLNINLNIQKLEKNKLNYSFKLHYIFFE